MTVIETLEKYLLQHFKEDLFQQPLFTTWEKALRFEIAEPAAKMTDADVLKQTVERAVTLFEEVFREEDDLLVVAQVYTKKGHNFLERRPLTTYRTFVKNQETLANLRYVEIPESPHQNGDTMVTHRFLQPGRKKDIEYHLLMELKCTEDIRMPLTGLKKVPNSRYEVFVINLSRNIIFNHYSEFGCDIIAADIEQLRFLYDTYNEWIEDANRERMDAMFLEAGA
ncbi:DUF3885 domain-containing protein [Sporosarcina aquimarina]|uniref:DUF3885 domain-containing protein n=2 Tax=Sporosarcina aquimarina TaxID=114975 RepID=A0ABU4G1U6_9BACL|nr:DUF3885 domain-containing protein [Sporosarcina aquimarina]